jgi:hypothetical protein
MGWDMYLYAYRPRDHDATKKICMRWTRQMPSPVGDWMLAWAVQEGSEAAVARAKLSDGDLVWNNDAWPDPYKTCASRCELWRLRDDHTDSMCDLCKWFHDGPSSSNKAMVVDVNNVHHSFGCSGDLMMSDWFVRHLCFGKEPVAEVAAFHDEEPEWIKGIYEDEDSDADASGGPPTMMFCEERKMHRLTSWTASSIDDARRRLAHLGEPTKQCDVDARDETLDVLAWAERHLEGGLRIVCVHDF